MGRLIRALLVVLLIGVVALAGVFAWLVVRGMPQRDGTATVEGLSAPVRVVRDQNGIANIYAATTEDLFAAQGWVHASERMWQMEIWRRIGAGRLSELFGADQVETDAYIRTLGWRAAAESDWEVISAEGRKAVRAYAHGVNAWLETHPDLPLPFVITGLQGAGGGLSGFRPEPWTPIDTLTWQKVQAWSLGDNMGVELLRMLLVERGLSEEQIADLSPAYDPSHPTVVPSGFTTSSDSPATTATSPRDRGMDASTATRLLARERALRATIGVATGGGSLAGSNGFVISPKRSATGAALLANDPHLDISMPSLWYLIGLHCEQISPACPYELAGAGFPGLPGIVLGHNARISWGLTNVGPDTQDLFEETLDPEDDRRYMYRGESRPFDTRTETISVSGGEEVAIEVRSTVHGPVVDDILGELQPVDEGGQGLGSSETVFSLAWAALTEPDRTLDSVLAVNRAGNWDEFREALRDFGAPSQTFLYADVDGHIGVQIPGRFPIRASGDGSFPVPGLDGSHDWTGFVDFDDLPYAFDPPEGIIVAANNQPVTPGVGPFLGRDFDPGYRAARIVELLDADETITTDLLRAIQGDTKLTRAAPVVAALTTTEPDTGDGELLRNNIVGWSGSLECRIDSYGCAAYETFEYWLLRGVLDDELGAGDDPLDVAPRYVGSEASHEFLTRLMSDPDSAWWDDVSTTGRVETLDDVVVVALDRAAADLRAAQGDPANWYWGRIHTVTFAEETLGGSGIAPLEWIFNKGPFPAPGSCTTVNKICGSIADDWPAPGEASDLALRFAAASSPSYRLVIDMSDLDEATILQTTGQSGIPFDAHYGDFIAPWLTNDQLPLPWSDDAVQAATRQTLTLQP